MRFFILGLVFILGFAGTAGAQRSDSIAAVVNGEIITFTDLYDRLDLVIKSSQMPNTVEFKKRLLPQVLTGLITETVQLQEAERLGHTVTEEEINEGFAKIAEQNNFTIDQFRAILRQQGVRLPSLERQIKAQLAWGKVIQSEIRPRVTVGDTEIADELSRLREKQGQEEYYIAEIYLPVTDADTEAKVRAAAQDLARQLSRDVQSFAAAARQFSQSSTAANGGVIGWVSLDQVDAPLADALRNMNVQQVSAPITMDKGYSIIYMQDKRVIDLDNAGGQQAFRIKAAVFPLANDQTARKAQAEAAESFARDVTGCLDIVKRTANQKNIRLDNIEGTAADIAPDIMTAISSLSVGEAGAPIARSGEIIVPMLCGRDGGNGMAAMEWDIEQHIGLQRMDILQKRLLRDLIAASYIERRV